MILKFFLIWLLIIPFAILNGAIRELLLNDLLGENLAQPISGISLSLIIFLIAFIFIPKLKVYNKKSYFYFIGLLWVSWTIIFEFSLGFVSGESFSKMLSAYNPLTGNLWLLVIIVTGISPWLTAKIKKLYYDE